MYWTPAGAHCRHCGAELVDDELFAAARMVRDAGTDRFSIRRVLADLGADRVADLTRAFQRHAAVLAAHVDALTIVEQALVVRGLAARLEAEQLPLLPWPVDVLDRYVAALPEPAEARSGSGPDTGARDDLRRAVAHIAAGTPFDLTRQAADVALLALDDWAVAGRVIGVLHAAAEESLRLDAALALSGWRARTMLVRSDLAWPSVEIDEVLRRAVADSAARPGGGTLTARAAVRLAGLSRDPERDALADLARSADLDDDSRFDVALQLGDLDLLRPALAAEPIDPVARIAAARVLIRTGDVDRLDAVLRDGPAEVVEAVVGELDRVRAVVPTLELALVGVVVSTVDPRTAQRATRVAARSLSPAGVRRIARARLDDGVVVQALLQGNGVAAESVRELADLLLAEERFSLSQFGVGTVAEDGRLGDGWVPARFHQATPNQQAELMRVAEVQLGARADEALHGFVLGVVFGAIGGDVRVQALWALRRWYRAGGDMRGEGPLALTTPGLAAVGWTVGDATAGLVRVLRDDTALRDVGMFEWLAALLRSADDEFVAAVVGRRHGAATGDRPGGDVDDGLAGALGALAASDHWSPLVAEARTLAGRLGS